MREFPVDRMRNFLHVRDKRALALHRVAVDMGPGSPVARLHILDDVQATANDSWPKRLKRYALVIWQMRAIVDDDVKTSPGVLKKRAQECDV